MPAVPIYPTPEPDAIEKKLTMAIKANARAQYKLQYERDTFLERRQKIFQAGAEAARELKAEHADLCQQLRQHRVSPVAGPLKREYDLLMERLQSDLPRMYVLGLVINNMAPGGTDFDAYVRNRVPHLQGNIEEGYQHLINWLDQAED